MAKNNTNKYHSVTSFKDIEREKEILLLRGKLVDTRISLDLLDLKRSISPSAIISSLAKEYLLPEIAALLHDIADRNK